MKKYKALVEEYDSQYGEDAYTYFEFFFETEETALEFINAIREIGAIATGHNEGENANEILSYEVKEFGWVEINEDVDSTFYIKKFLESIQKNRQEKK